MKLHVLEGAEDEIEAARQYFNRQAWALGDRFLNDLADTLEQIEATPASFPKLETLPDHKPYRRALLKVFRYAVIFEIHDETVLVVAVTHTSRKPNYWISRRKMN